MKHILFAACLFLFTHIPTTAQATRTITPLHNAKTLTPGEIFNVTIETQEPLQVGWRMTKDTQTCEDNCVSAAQQSNGQAVTTFSSQHGGSMEYSPQDGTIMIEYTNATTHDVTIDIYSQKEICDSQACTLLKENSIAHPYDYSALEFDWKRVRLAHVETIETSEDGSYSHIKGETIYGTSFDVYTIWWLIENPKWGGSCKKWIPEKAGQYKKGTKKVYFFAGSPIIVGGKNTNIMTDIGCSWTDAERDKNDL